MKIKAIASRLMPMLVLVAVSATSVQAQFIPAIKEVDTRDQAVMKALEDYMTASNGNHALKKFRTGPNEDKPLGNYFVEPYSAYKSAYAKLSLDQQAKFAYDLNQYRKTANLD